MNKAAKIGIGVTAAIAAVVGIKKIKDAAVFKSYLKFNKVAEGGLSRKTSDTASDNPCPDPYKGQYGYHTNKGVTWTTFIHSSKRMGFNPSSSLFFSMPDKLASDILKKMYWDAFNLDKCKNKSIAVVVCSWAWGSGVTGGEIRLARFQRDEMGIVDFDITPHEITENFNKSKLSARQLFDKLCQRREDDFRAMNQPLNLNGWLKRLERFKKAFRPSLISI